MQGNDSQKEDTNLKYNIRESGAERNYSEKNQTKACLVVQISYGN